MVPNAEKSVLPGPGPGSRGVDTEDVQGPPRPPEAQQAQRGFLQHRERDRVIAAPKKLADKTARNHNAAATFPLRVVIPEAE